MSSVPSEIQICYGLSTKRTPSNQLFTTKRNTLFNWPWCVSIHTYVYIYTYLYICIQICIYINIYSCICMRVSRKWQCAWNVDMLSAINKVNTFKSAVYQTAHLFQLALVCKYTYILIYIRIYVYVYINIYIYTYIYTYKYMYTCITRWAVCVKCRYVIGYSLREHLQISYSLPNRKPFSIRHSV